MSEEQQSSFKITDRRLFNSDGSPRETEQQQRDDLTEVPPSLGGGADVSGATIGSEAERGRGDFAAGPESGQPPTAETRAQDPGERGGEAHATGPEDEEMFDVDDNDPASFTSFLMSIASNAAASLGLMEHPVTGARAVDLELAKHWIDTLGMLQQKTRGNLNARERQILEGLLADMRMQYVSLTSSAAAPGGRRFKGSDITGGR